MAENRVGSIVIDAKMDKQDFMNSSKDVAQAVKSLRDGITQSGKTMKASAAGYGTAMRQVLAASREANGQVRELDKAAGDLKAKLDRLGQSKVATPALKETVNEIKNAEKALERLQARQTKMNELGTNLTKSYQELKADGDKLLESMRGQSTAIKENNALAKILQEELRTGRNIENGAKLDNSQITGRKDALEKLRKEQKTLREDYAKNQKAFADNMAERKAALQSGEAYSQQAKSLEYDIEQQEKYIDKLKATRDQMMQQEGIGFVSGDKTQEYKDAAARYAEIMQMRQRAMSQMGEDFKPPYMKWFDDLPRLTSMVSEGFGRIQNVASGAAYAITHPFQTLDRALGSIITSVGRAVSALGKMAGNAAISFIKRLASEARNAAIQLAKLAANAVSSGLKKIATWAGMAAKSMLTFNRANRSSNGGLKTSLKTILKYAFGVRSMFFLFRRLRKAVTDGFGALKEQSPEVKAAMDSLSQASNALKGSLAAAFAPILTAIAPALTTLINMLATAINTIGAFFAALTGKNTVAKSIGKIGSAAGKASGKAKELKRQLAGFDELNILEANDNSGGGGGGSGSGYSYKTENIAANIKDFADRVRAMWAAGDYEGIGHEIAGFINKTFVKAEEFITWDNLEKKIQKGLDAVVGVFNGLVDPAKGINFNRIGSTVAAGIDSLLHIFNRLLDPKDGLNIEGAGRAFASALNGLFNNASMWQQAGRLLTNWIRAYIRFSDAFLQEFNEGKVASGIRTALAEIPWGNIASEAWDTIKLAFNKAGNFMNVLLGGKDFGASAGNDAKAQIEQMAAGFTPMISSGVSYDGVWDELAVNLGKAFDSMVKKLTGIIEDVPVEDAVQAVLNWLQRIRDNALADGSVGTLFGTIFKKAFGAFATVVTDFKKNASANGTLIAKAINAAVHTAFSGGENPGTVITDLITGAFDFVKALLEGFDAKDAAEQLKTAVEGIKWGEIARAAWDAFKLAVSKLGSFLTVLFDGEETEVPVKPVIKPSDKHALEKETLYGDVTAGVKSSNTFDLSAEGLAKTASNVFESALGKLKDIIESVDWVSVGEDIGKFIANVDWGSLAQAVFSVFQSILGGINDLLSGVDDSLSKKFFGDDYKDNEWWQLTHPVKAAKHRDEQYAQWRQDNPEKAAVLDARAQSGVGGLIDFLREPFLAGKKFDTFGDLLLDYADRTQKIQEENEKATILAQAAKTEMDKQGISADEALQRYIDAGVDTSVLNLVAAAIGANTDLLEQVKVAEEANTAANESNTTAIDANTTETASTPEQTDNPDVVGDLLKYALGKVEEVTGSRDTTSQSELGESVSQLSDIISDLGLTIEESDLLGLTGDRTSVGAFEQDELEAAITKAFTAAAEQGRPDYVDELLAALPADMKEENAEAYKAQAVAQQAANDALQLALDMVKSGATVEEAIASMNLSEENIEKLVAALDANTAQIEASDKPTHKGLQRGGDSPASKLAGKAQAALDAQKNEVTEDDISATKKQTKITNKLSKLYKKRLEPQEVEVDYQGAGFDTQGDKPKLNVGVNFVPAGEEEGEGEEGGGGLLGWLQKLLDADTLEARIALLKEGWESVAEWLGIDPNTPFTAVIALLKDKWDSIRQFLGIPEDGIINTMVKALLNRDWPGILAALGLPPNATVGAVIEAVMQQGWGGIAKLFGLGDGNILEVIGKLLGSPASGSQTIGGLFGTILSIAGFLLGSPANGSNTLGGVFGTVLQFLGKLTGKDTSGYVTLGGLFGTVLGFLGKLTGKDGSSLPLSNVFGTVAGFLGKITGKDSSSLNLNSGSVFGSLVGFLGKITGKDSSSLSLNSDSVFGRLVGFLGKITGKDSSSLSLNNTNVFGNVATFLAKLTGKDTSGKYNSFGDLFGTSFGVKSGLAGTTSNGNAWNTALSGLFGDKFGVKSGLSGKTTNGNQWKLTLAGLFGDKFGAKSGLSGTTSNGHKWGTSLGGLFGTSFSASVGLTRGREWKDGITKWITGNTAGTIGLIINFAASAGTALKAALRLIGINLATGGVISSTGNLMRFANGGSIMNRGRASWWDSVNKYAAGTSRAHGTVFVAGESGPEIMGHVNGRTEILNKSQLADAIYGAVVSGMAQAVNKLGVYLANHMTNCTNAIVSTIGSTAELSTVRGLDYYAPAMATGGIMPYDVSAQIARSTTAIQGTLDANNEDLIQAMVSAIGNASMTIVSAIQSQMRGSGNGLTAQQLINEINRQGVMYGRTPIKGV